MDHYPPLGNIFLLCLGILLKFPLKNHYVFNCLSWSVYDGVHTQFSTASRGLTSHSSKGYKNNQNLHLRKKLCWISLIILLHCTIISFFADWKFNLPSLSESLQ